MNRSVKINKIMRLHCNIMDSDNNSILSGMRSVTSSFFPLVNRLIILIPTVIFVYLLFILISNASRGFDITDESAYLLWAMHPGQVLALLSSFGYYTHILYLLSHENIMVFRILGIGILLITSLLFSVFLDNYWFKSSVTISNYPVRWTCIIAITVCILMYYRIWLLTPSYNWLALFSTLLVGIGLLHFAFQEYGESQKENISFKLFLDGLLVGVGGGIAFVAKPTTALILAVASLYWIVLHLQHGRWKPFLGFSVAFASLLLLVNAIAFRGGVIPFYNAMHEGLVLQKILGHGHTFYAILLQATKDIMQVPARELAITSKLMFLLPFILGAIWWSRKRENGSIVLVFLLVLFVLATCYLLRKAGYWSKEGIGFYSITLLLSMVLSALIVRLSKKPCENGKTFFLPLVSLCFLLFMLAIAYAFGSSNGLVRKMSGAYIFMAAGATYAAVWIDQYLDKKIVGNVIAILVSVCVLVLILQGLKSPYRLPRAVNEQTVKCSFLAGNGFLYVDKPTSRYINDLKSIALKNGWEPGMPLLDLTGGSPGAAVILGGRFLGTPWLIGGYKGSYDFIEAVLKKVKESDLKVAWVLTAPNGKRRVDEAVLSAIGLSFPESYKRVGEVRSGHRNEIQILWKPLSGKYGRS